MCEVGISTTIRSKIYVQGKTETSSCINSMQDISYIKINGRFTISGGCKYGVINTVSVINVN